METYKSELSDTEILQSQQMSHELWGGGISFEERLKKLKQRMGYANGSLLSLSGIIDEKGILLTSLKQYYANLLFRQNRLNAIGLGAIFTNETFRRKGWAKRLISIAIEEAREEGYQCAYLFSDIGEKYYSDLGFITLPYSNFKTNTENLPSGTDLDAREARPADIDQILKIYENTFSEDDLHVQRDKTYWNFFIELNTQNPIQVLTDKERIIGYFSLCDEGQAAWLDECITEKGYESQALGHIRKYMQSRGLTTLSGWEGAHRFHKLNQEVTPRKKSVPMVLFFYGLPQDWASEKSWFSPLDHF